MIQALERGNYYHIYNRGINRGDLFKETTNFEYFLNLFETHIEPIAEIYAWCLMKNHFHFIIRLKEIEEIKCKKSFILLNLFQIYSTLTLNHSIKSTYEPELCSRGLSDEF